MYEPLTHEINISKHYPPTVNDFEEFIEIGKVENSNFNRVRIELLQLFSMRFVHDTDEVGIARWEKMLKLKRRASDSLETRRVRVLAKINNKLPYTWRTLNQLLTSIFGEGNYHINLDPQEYIIELLIPSEHSYYRELLEILEPMIPLNIYLMIAEGILKDVLQAIVGPYSWIVNGRICGRFKTATRPGNTDKLPPFALNPYTFPFDGPIAGRFKTATVPGALATNQLNLTTNGYTFGKNKRRCGKFRAGGAQ